MIPPVELNRSEVPDNSQIADSYRPVVVRCQDRRLLHEIEALSELERDRSSKTVLERYQTGNTTQW